MNERLDDRRRDDQHDRRPALRDAQGAPLVETSKTRRVYLILRDRIVSGELTPGTRLPSEPDLSDLHRVSRVTIRRALAELEREGLISRRPGAGTFVTSGALRRPIVADLANALAHLVEMGRNTTVKLVQVGYVEAAPEIAEALRLEREERVQRSVRIRYMDGEPFSRLVAHVPERVASTYSEEELASAPLLALIERTGARLESATQAIGAALAGPDVAAALDIEAGAPLITLTRVVFDQKKRAVEHLAATYRPDRYRFQMDLIRIDSGGDRLWSPVQRLGAPAPVNDP